MLNVVIVISILASGLAADMSNRTMPPIEPHIFGGTATNINDLPWQISLQYKGSHVCGGSIIARYYILTAAHCVVDTPAVYLRIRAGSSYRNTGGVLVPVERVIVHEGYSKKTVNNDIAVLRLSAPLTFGATIKPIILSTKAPPNLAPVLISGWGTKASGATSLPLRLRSTVVFMLSKTMCRSSRYGYGSEVFGTMICGAASGKDTCQGDSGGPMVYKKTLAGITSWGYGCARARYPGIYTNVALMRPWIKSKCGLTKDDE